MRSVGPVRRSHNFISQFQDLVPGRRRATELGPIAFDVPPVAILAEHTIIWSRLQAAVLLSLFSTTNWVPATPITRTTQGFGLCHSSLKGWVLLA